MTPARALPISWLPSWVESGSVARIHFSTGDDDAGADYLQASRYVCDQPRVDSWQKIAAGLRRAAAGLRGIPIADIVAAIGHVADQWCQRDWPPRNIARDRVVAATGLSREVVDRSFDVELRNYRSDALWRALRRELGDPAALDGFVTDPLVRGRTRALGPDLTLQILTGNVPGLPALAIVRSLLVKSALIVKVGSGEPTFAALFAASLAEVEPRLGQAILVTYWDRSDADMLAAAAGQADVVVAYGGAEACAEARRHVRADQRFIEHGHKVSAGLISASYQRRLGAAEIARRIVHDTCMFNQLACIAPQAFLIEAEPDAVLRLGEVTAEAMEHYRRGCAAGRLSLDDAMALQLRRIGSTWKASARRDGEIWHAAGFDWTVVVDNEFPIAGGGNRFITLIPVSSLSEGVSILRPFARYLQNIALGCNAAEFSSTAGELAALGASRICEPGNMTGPSLGWRHDGHMCIAELVRWCDVEAGDGDEYPFDGMLANDIDRVGAVAG